MSLKSENSFQLEIPVPSRPSLTGPLSPPRKINNGTGMLSPNRNNTKSRRGVSLDSAAYRNFVSTPQKDTVLRDARALSASDSVMKRLAFENTDLLNTPLSSLRSCSEYNKGDLPTSRENSDETPKSKSFLSSFFSWNNKKTDKKKKNKVRFRDSKEDQVFMIDNFRFNEANLLAGEDYNYRNNSNNALNSSSILSSERSRSRDEEIQSIGTYSIHSKAKNYSHSTSSTSGGNYNNSNKKKKRNNSFMAESTAAWDYVFGYGPRNKNMPMEIELRDLSAPQLLNVYHCEEFEQEERLSNAHLLQDEAFGIMGIRRVTSLGSFQRLRADSTESTRTSIISHSSAHSAGFLFVTFDLKNPKTYIPWARDRLIVKLAEFRHFYSVHIRSNTSDLFYECIRIQPFAAGSYMRGMLSAGFCSMTFNIYNIMSWQSKPNLSSYGVIFDNILYIFVVLQLLLNIIQLPFRLQINSLCWDSSRVVEVDEAINFMRTMLQSDAWILNRSIGIVFDGFNILMLVLCECYLWSSAGSSSSNTSSIINDSSSNMETSTPDLLRIQIISLCATSLLTILIRILVATVFGLSMHDPEVLSNARRRGLSKWDLDVLPSFVYSSTEDVNNADCCICLGCFELGEMLTCLPCDKKHSFHAGCIRSWLERQNSCPLCQKMV